MADFIQKIFMTKQQRAMFNATDSGRVQIQTGYTQDLLNTFSTTSFFIPTNLGMIQATYSEQGGYALRPKNTYTVILRDESEKVIINKYNGMFAKALYNKLEQRYRRVR